MPRMRWYLREGWSRPAAHYGSEPVELLGPAAAFLLPSFDATPLELVLTTSGSATANVVVNGIGAGGLVADQTPKDQALVIPGRTLFRGDNIVTLRRTSPEGSTLRLHRIAVYPVDGD
jgi:hypothetical protein